MVYLKTKYGTMCSSILLEETVLKKLMDKIDRFCYTHPNFGVPRLMMYVVIGNLLVFLLSAMDTTGLFKTMLVFSPEMITVLKDIEQAAESLSFLGCYSEA